MWRLGRNLVGQCVYLDKDISFIGVISAKVHAIYIGGKQVFSAYISVHYFQCLLLRPLISFIGLDGICHGIH